MRIHCLQHVPWHGRAFIPLWAAAAGHDWQVTLVPEAERLPAPESFDALIIMGGPMSLREQAKYPWLVAEQRLLEDVLRRGQPFLGICLGAQMLAAVHGALARVDPRSANSASGNSVQKGPSSAPSSAVRRRTTVPG